MIYCKLFDINKTKKIIKSDICHTATKKNLDYINLKCQSLFSSQELNYNHCVKFVVVGIRNLLKLLVRFPFSLNSIKTLILKVT